MSSPLVLIPKLTIHPDRICAWSETKWLVPHSKKVNPETGEIENEGNIVELLKSDRKSHGVVSFQAKRKVSKAIDYLLLMSNQKAVESRFSGKMFNFKIAFITLTLPSQQIHSDREIKEKCLNSFLLELKKYYHVKNYVWRSERQQNGNVHFHLLVDKFVPWSELRDRWNRIINKLGYVDRYRDNMKEYFKAGFRVRQELLKKWSKQAQFNAYKSGSKTGWNSPNSTDIHSIRKIRNLKLYITKYLTKTVKEHTNDSTGKNQEVYEAGRIWGCNQELSNVKGAQIEVDSQISNEMHRLIQVSKCNNFHDPYFDVYYLTVADLVKFDCRLLFKIFCQYLLDTFNYSYQFSLQ